MYRNDADRLATFHTRFISDSRWYAAEGDQAMAKRKLAQARRIERELLAGGHRILLGELVELSNLYGRLEGNADPRPELHARVLTTLDRVAALILAA